MSKKVKMTVELTIIIDDDKTDNDFIMLDNDLNSLKIVTLQQSFFDVITNSNAGKVVRMEVKDVEDI